MKDLRQMKFGKLTAVSLSEKRVGGRVSWDCICDCGKTKTVSSNHLKCGTVKSCGCLSRGGGRPRLKMGQASFNILLKKYKYSAKTRNIEFSLTDCEFSILTQGNCYYCGQNPSNSIKHGGSVFGDFIHNGIDRVDNDLGYYPDNCVSCCKSCNRLKGNMDLSPFLTLVKQIYIHSKL